MDDNREPGNMELVHLLRAVTVEFGLRQAEFAARNGMHPTDVRALICLLDAARAAEPATAGLLGARLGLNSVSYTHRDRTGAASCCAWSRRRSAWAGSSSGP